MHTRNTHTHTHTTHTTQTCAQNTVVYAGAAADRDIIRETEFWYRGGATGQGDFK